VVRERDRSPEAPGVEVVRIDRERPLDAGAGGGQGLGGMRDAEFAELEGREAIQGADGAGVFTADLPGFREAILERIGASRSSRSGGRDRERQESGPPEPGAPGGAPASGRAIRGGGERGHRSESLSAARTSDECAGRAAPAWGSAKAE
jgi:hypothetical protein